MRRSLVPICLALFAASLSAETNAKTKAGAPAAAQTPSPQVFKDLPVRKVVLYKNGVGYFEHAGTVTGNQTVGIDFTSPQLNDVLQSLTVLDEGGGRIAGVNYNSTTPLAEQLKTLALGMSDDPTSTELFQAMRGQRVEVTGGPGGTITGRLMSIETRTEKTGGGDNASTVDRFYLTLVASTGAVRVIELTPSLSVRPLDSILQQQVDRYLEMLSSARSTGLRHLTLNALGSGQRQLRVSYISEVPVWKSTYRIVFPQAGDKGSADAIVQGWAVVDNTVGADWSNVQLSLVAGSPQSFIQPLSQPLYTRRPEVPIATGVETTPQTHEAAEMAATESGNRALVTPARIPSDMQMAAKLETPPPTSFGVAGMEGTGGASGGVIGGLFTGTGSGGGMGVGGVYRPSDAIIEGDVSTNAFDDFFQYALTQPVTIRRNESAMVPILQQNLPAEHVTLWSESSRNPLRALWLDNKSSLTLDSGSFSVFESGEFAGEGLLDPVHPGEKRLLSYAVDQAVRVHHGGYSETRTLHHIAMHEGVMVETSTQIWESTYTVTNGADETRTVIVEHRRKPGAKLDSDPAPEETTAGAYRFRVIVKPHESVDLHVGEEANQSSRLRIGESQFRSEYLLNVSKYTPDLEQKLKPLIDAGIAVSDLDRKIADLQQKEKTLADDEARARDNITALKNGEASRRFVDELNTAEDGLQAARKDRTGLEQQRDAAQARLNALIAAASFEFDVTVRTESTQHGDRRPPQ